MTDHRWQGYGHAELYARIHQGPGPNGSASSMNRWRELISALDEIDQDLHATLDGSAHAWEGAAADQARSGLSPLRAWAAHARSEAETMRLSAELQADYVAKARNDMPPPGVVTAEEPSTFGRQLTHLFGGQTDYEVQETAANAAEQKAFDVMAEYQASTESNTATLGRFTPPPEVVVSTTITPSPGRRITGPEPDTESVRRIRGGDTGRGATERRTTGRGRTSENPVRRNAGTARPGTEPEPGRSAKPSVPAESGASAESTPARSTEPTAARSTAPVGPDSDPGQGSTAARPTALAVDEPDEPLLEREDVFGEQHTIAPPVLGEIT